MATTQNSQPGAAATAIPASAPDACIPANPEAPDALPNGSAPGGTRTPKGPDWWLMMRAFLTQGKKIASFAPSSRFMARKLLDGIDWTNTQTIVELGAGTGPITAVMTKLARPETKLIVIELDPILCGRLRERFRHAANVDVILGDATCFGDLLAERGIQQVDHVISGLPLPSFPAVARDAVLEMAAKTIAAHGTFRQITVMPLVYYKLYRRYFDDVRFRFVPFNLPPGGVYVCRGYRGTLLTTQ